MESNHQVLERLITECAALESIATAVACPLSEVALRGALDAAAAGLIEPVLVGPEAELRALADTLKIDLADAHIVDVADDLAAAAKAVARCRCGECEALMKGSLHTDHLTHEVLADASGLKTRRRESHVFVLDVPNDPKTLLLPDAAVNTYPTLEDKADIVQNAIDLPHALGDAGARRYGFHGLSYEYIAGELPRPDSAVAALGHPDRRRNDDRPPHDTPDGDHDLTNPEQPK